MDKHMQGGREWAGTMQTRHELDAAARLGLGSEGGGILPQRQG